LAAGASKIALETGADSSISKDTSSGKAFEATLAAILNIPISRIELFYSFNARNEPRALARRLN
jgi:hypothetical protein